MKTITALVSIEIALMLVGAVLGPTFYQSMLCGMALVPFLFLATGLLSDRSR